MQKHVAVITANNVFRSVMNEALVDLARDLEIDICVTDGIENEDQLDVIITTERLSSSADDIQLTFLLALGADSGLNDQTYDYMFPMPCRMGSVIDRIGSIFKGQAVGRIQRRLKVLNWLLCLPENKLIADESGVEVELTDKESEILRRLYVAGSNGMGKQDLLSEVWAYHQDVETHTLETHIYRLRQKLEQDPSNPKVLVTEADGYYLKR